MPGKSTWKTRNGKENLSDLLSRFRTTLEEAQASDTWEREAARRRARDLADRLTHHPDIDETPVGPEDRLSGNLDRSDPHYLPHGDVSLFQRLAEAAGQETMVTGGHTAGTTRTVRPLAELDRLDRQYGLDPERRRPSAATIDTADRWYARQVAAEKLMPKPMVRIPVSERDDLILSSRPGDFTAQEQAAALDRLVAADRKLPADDPRRFRDTYVDSATGDPNPYSPAEEGMRYHFVPAGDLDLLREREGGFAGDPDAAVIMSEQMRAHRDAAQRAEELDHDFAGYARQTDAPRRGNLGGHTHDEPADIAAVRSLVTGDPTPFDDARKRAAESDQSLPGADVDRVLATLSNSASTEHAAAGLILPPRAGVTAYWTEDDIRDTLGPVADAVDAGDTDAVKEKMSAWFPEYGSQLNPPLPLDDAVDELMADLERERTDGDGPSRDQILASLAGEVSACVPVDDLVNGMNLLAHTCHPDGTPRAVPTRDQLGEAVEDIVESHGFDNDKGNATLYDADDCTEVTRALCARYPDADPEAMQDVVEDALLPVPDEEDLVDAEGKILGELYRQVGAPTPGVGEPGYGRVKTNGTHVFRMDSDGTWAGRPAGSRGKWTRDVDVPASAQVVPPSEAAALVGGSCLACGRSLKKTPASGYGPTCARKFA